MLGLNVLGKKTAKELEQDKKNGFEGWPKFVPLSFLTGQPEILAHYTKRLEQEARDKAASEDQTFEAFSSALHQFLKTGKSMDLPGDMVPLLTGDLKDIERNSYWKSEEVQQQLAALGVKPRGESKAVAHVSSKPKFLEDQQKEKQKEREQLAEVDPTKAGELPKSKRKRIDLDMPMPGEAEIEKFRRALSGKKDSDG